MIPGMMLVGQRRGSVSGGGGGGAFPIIQSVTPSILQPAATSHSVAHPATVNTGDRLLYLITFRRSTNSAFTVTPPGTVTMLQDTTILNSFVRTTIYERTADGTEGGSSYTFTTSVATEMAAQVVRISGATSAVAVSTTASGSTTTAFNPLGLTSGLSGNILWMVCEQTYDTTAVTTWPSGFTDNQTVTNSGGALPVTVAIASKNDTATTLDPGAGVFGTAVLSRSFTLAIAP